MDDLKDFTVKMKRPIKRLSYLQENFPNVKICTWDPDPERYWIMGMFVDEFEPELWSKFGEHLESEDCWVYNDMIELYLETDEGIKDIRLIFRERGGIGRRTRLKIEIISWVQVPAPT